MKRSLLLFCMLLACMHFASAKLNGKARIDSLQTELNKAVQDTQKVFLMTQISFAYATLNPDEGLKYGTNALQLANKINWQKGIGIAHYYRGANYLYTSKFPEAIDDYLGALKYFETVGDSLKLAGTYSNIGNVYGYQEKDDKALEYFQKALAINLIKNPNSNFIAANLGNIGAIYFKKNDFAKALNYNLQTLKISQENNFMDMLPNALSSIAKIYLEVNDNVNALLYAQRAREISQQADDINVLANSYTTTGVAIMQMVAGNNQHLIDSLFKGNKQAAIASAKASLDSAFVLINQVGDQQQLAEWYKYRATFEESNGNYKEALQYHKLFKSVNDTIFNADKNEKILQTALEYDFEKKEAATKAEQEKKDIRQRNIRNSIATGLAGALVFGIVVYRQRNKIKAGKKRSDELLLNILPEEVAEELKEKGSADAKQFDEVTVMFTDFKGFTKISENLTPAELVSEIHTCFKAFDNIITKHNIEKIKTIGDSYMCAGGLPVANKTHATDMVSAALEIQQFMHQHLNERKNQNKQVFEVRIGVHTGTVVAGIVGVKKFAYDIWGDTVNIASRMESSGEAGKVNISGSTYPLVKDKFSCTYRGKIEAKNKGEVDMYFVQSMF